MNQIIMAYDFFDTIVHRDCHPEAILYEWARRCSRYWRFKIHPGKLYSIRKNVERTEKRKKDIEELPYEKLLRLIYDKIGLSDFTFEEFYYISSEIERKTELEHIYLDQNCINEIKNYYLLGKRIILISDFYNDSKFIKYILNYFNIELYFEKIYISSDINKTKASGSMYEYILNDMQELPQNIVMHGDNVVSDVKMPRKYGMGAILREYKSKYTIINDNQLKQKYRDILFNDYKKQPLNGYLGDIIYFISRLYRELIINGHKKVLFCSREGQFLKKIFDDYQNIFWKDNLIDTKYFYISRKAALLSSLKDFENEKFEMIFRQFSKLYIGDFLNTLGFTEYERNKVLNETQLDFKAQISIGKDNLVYQKLSSCREFLKIYNDKRELQHNNFIMYLKQLGLEKDEDIVLIDVGWKGTIQDCIQKILKTRKIIGYYLGLRTKEFGCSNSEKKEGILFTDSPVECEYYNLLSRGYMFYERIFVADHGAVLGYRINDKGVISPILDDNKDELNLYHFMKDYQKSLEEGFQKLLYVYRATPYDPCEKKELMLQCSLWKQCVHFPKIWKIEKIARNICKENFGNISKNNEKKKEYLGKEQLNKKDFLFSDYSFRILDKLKLQFLYPLAECYCRIVYVIKKIQFRI